MSAQAATPLPGSYRWALVLAVVVGFQVSLAAAFELNAAINYPEPASLGVSEASFPGLGLSPLAQRRLALAAASGQQSALEAMLPWRIATALLLAVSSGLVFLFGMRLRISQEHRISIAGRLGAAALVAAVFRSIDGAQNLVITRATFMEMGKAYVREGGPDAEAYAAGSTLVGSVVSAGWTLVMVAAFVTLGNYFRSEALREALRRAEP